MIIKFYNEDTDLFPEEKYLKLNTFHSHPQSKPDQQEHQQKEELSPFIKRILIVDDHPDIILSSRGLEAENEYSSGKIFFQVHAYDDPLLALSVYNLIYTVAKPAGGILFGIAFGLLLSTFLTRL